jgi:hypothetical protein
VSNKASTLERSLDEHCDILSKTRGDVQEIAHRLNKLCQGKYINHIVAFVIA